MHDPPHSLTLGADEPKTNSHLDSIPVTELRKREIRPPRTPMHDMKCQGKATFYPLWPRLRISPCDMGT